MSRSPIPRFDLLQLDKYTAMSVQFSRGCPFQCEFCDIITIYGRKPRTKSPAQLIVEREVLRELGWRTSLLPGGESMRSRSHSIQRHPLILPPGRSFCLQW